MLWLLERLPAGVIGMSSLTFPVIAITAGVFFAGERFGVREFAGSSLVVLGMAIALVRLPGRARSSQGDGGSTRGDVRSPAVLCTNQIAERLR